MRRAAAKKAQQEKATPTEKSKEKAPAEKVKEKAPVVKAKEKRVLQDRFPLHLPLDQDWRAARRRRQAVEVPFSLRGRRWRRFL